MDEKAYCPFCRKDVSFTECLTEEHTELDGTVYSFPSKQAICAECGEEATYQPYMEEAGTAFNEAVRQAKGLASLEVIRNLPKKYRIGKRPLSLLLGWGEITYTRFVEGMVPSREYSDLIERLYDDPAAYYRVLTRGKDRIADVAYRKSEQAVESILSDSFPDATKIYEVADYFCTLSEGDMTVMMIQKLTYYAQGFSYVFLDAPLFEQQPKAWATGPVYGQLWREFKDRNLEAEFGGGRCAAAADLPFTSDEEQLLKAVFDSFGRYSGTVLSRMTHAEKPWLSAWNRTGVEDENLCREPIQLPDLKSFFSETAHRFDMGGVRDIKRYAESAFSAACS